MKFWLKFAFSITHWTHTSMNSKDKAGIGGCRPEQAQALPGLVLPASITCDVHAMYYNSHSPHDQLLLGHLIICHLIMPFWPSFGNSWFWSLRQHIISHSHSSLYRILLLMKVYCHLSTANGGCMDGNFICKEGIICSWCNGVTIVLIYSIIGFLLWHIWLCLVFLVFLTVALVLGVNKSNPGPGDYSQPLDGIRLFCEVMVLLMIMPRWAEPRGIR